MHSEIGATPLGHVISMPDGSNIAYVCDGPPDAEPVILLHGFAGSRRTWRHQLHALAPKYRAFAVDWLGWGESDKPAHVPYDYWSEVERLRHLIERLIQGPCTLIGHDYGGFLALGLSQKYPKLVSRLGIVNSRAQRTFRPLWYVGFHLLGAGTRLFGRAMPWLLMTRLFLREELKAGIIDQASWIAHTQPMRSRQGKLFLRRYFKDYELKVRHELLKNLSYVTCPTAVIWGARDKYIGVATARELEATLPRVNLTLIETAGHFVTEEAPSAVTEAILDLMRIQIAQS